MLQLCYITDRTPLVTSSFQGPWNHHRGGSSKRLHSHLKQMKMRWKYNICLFCAFVAERLHSTHIWYLCLLHLFNGAEDKWKSIEWMKAAYMSWLICSLSTAFCHNLLESIHQRFHILSGGETDFQYFDGDDPKYSCILLGCQRVLWLHVTF